MEKRIETLKEVFEEFRQEESNMIFRHPGFNVVYNWVIAILAVLLTISLVSWGLDIRTERKAEAMTQAAMESWQADLQAAEDAKAEELAALKATREYVMAQEATVIAKAFYGVRNFVEKYHYGQDDLETYARCMFNRAEGGDLIAVVTAKDQFLGYSDSNPVLTENYDLALKLVEEWHTETTKPCDISYRFAELTPDGIFLKADLHADGYARRWHA